jgi:drug/metabolite transporter (DMT)-like permease
MTPERPSAATTWLALATVYVVWGSTYLAIRYTVEGLPPLLAMGARFVAAGVLLAGYLLVRRGWRALRPTRRQLFGCGVVGVLLLLCGNGGVAVGEQRIASGQAALVVATVPLWVVLIRLAAGDRPRPLSVVGSVVGFAGIAVLTAPQMGGRTGLGLLVVFLASFSWSVGSWLSPRLGLPRDALVATTWQMLLGGAAMLLVGALSETGDLRIADAQPSAWWALAYLVLIGSLLGYTAFSWLLANAPISLTATYAYVNPVVAVALGALFVAEPITATTLVGGAIVVAGVVLVVRAERRRAPDVPVPDTPPARTPEPARVSGTTRG